MPEPAPAADPHDPLPRFHAWLADARARKLPEPTAMSLATVSADGSPSVRMVLLKHADADGFVFYTNLESPKAAALRSRPEAELCFYWNPPGRQVRIHGSITPVSDAEADAYFASRPYLSRIGAWASEQSRPLPVALALPGRVAEFTLRFAASVPRPPHWGGFRLKPTSVEFWEEKPYRLHERVVHRRASGGWTVTPLYP
jgi:pyridoxamine-phosphate oxidase